MSEKPLIPDAMADELAKRAGYSDRHDPRIAADIDALNAPSELEQAQAKYEEARNLLESALTYFDREPGADGEDWLENMASSFDSIRAFLKGEGGQQ